MFCSLSCKLKTLRRRHSRRGMTPTPEELVVWKLFPLARWNYYIRSGQLKADGRRHGYKIDVAFLSLKLGVEIDGGIHRIPSVAAKDKARDKRLTELGWTILRFSNRQVTKDLTRVQEVIEYTISKLEGTQVIPSTV